MSLPAASRDEPRSLVVDQGACIGAGQCVFLAPNHFTQRDTDGVVELLVSEVDVPDRADVEEAIVQCPAQVIRMI